MINKMCIYIKQNVSMSPKKCRKNWRRFRREEWFNLRIIEDDVREALRRPPATEDTASKKGHSSGMAAERRT